MTLPMPGTDYDWDAPTKLKTKGVNGSTVPLPYGLDPARVPVAGTYVDGPQQQSKLTSAWYELPRPDAAHPLVVVTAAGTIAGNSVLNGAHRRADRSNWSTRCPDPAERLCQGAGWCPTTSPSRRRGAICVSTAP